jgi:hypothetical protein
VDGGVDRVGLSLVEKGTLVTRMRKPLVSVGGAALLVAFLAGCGTVTPGSAAVVRGHRISVSDVQEATVEAQTWVGNGAQVLPAQVLHLLAIQPYVQEIAARYGVGVSEDEARKILRTRVKNPSPTVVTVIRTNISLSYLQQNLGEQHASQLLGEATRRLVADGFTVNPRFGSFDVDPKTGIGHIAPIQPSWLVGPEAESGSTVPR